VLSPGALHLEPNYHPNIIRASRPIICHREVILEQEEYARMAALEGEHWWYRGMRSSLRRTINDLDLSPNARILDAGCGTGGNLAWLEQTAPAFGLDLSAMALAHACTKTSAALVRADISALPFGSGRFNVVVCLDVLYHNCVSDDEKALLELDRMLSPLGWLILRVPAHDWLRGCHDLQVHTTRRYSREGLRQKLWRAGYTLKFLSPIGLWLLPVAVLRRSWQMVSSNGPPHSDIKLPNKVINNMLGGLLAWESRLAARRTLPWGLSLFAIAQKSVTV